MSISEDVRIARTQRPEQAERPERGTLVLRPMRPSKARDARAAIDAAAGIRTPTLVAPRRVLAIVSGSRDGGGLLFQLLRRTGAFQSLDGAHTHLYQLHGLGTPAGEHTCDADVTSARGLPAVLQDLLRDCTVPDAAHDLAGDEYAVRLARRLVVQWPTRTPPAHLDLDVARRCVCAARPGQTAETIVFDVVRRLAAVGFDVDPAHYDVPRWRRLPSTGQPPHAGPFLESPPYAVPSRTAVRPGAGTGKPRLVHAPIDAFRVDLVQELFPDSEVRFVHLFRDPASAVNALIDGWLDSGFFTHALEGDPLRIEGYSHTAWGRRLWNFDLFPGWQQHLDDDLASVCAQQWASSHRAILESLYSSDCLRVSYAHLTGDRHLRTAALRGILEYAGVTLTARPRTPAMQRPMITTVAPPPRRWSLRDDTIVPVLHDPAIRDVSERLEEEAELQATWA
ncbi:MAG: hypothetical protein ACTHJH_17965 [Marmoricola sp.]